MTREEATAIAHSDPESIIRILLELCAQIADMERRMAQLTTDSSNSSKPPSSDGPAAKPRARPPVKSKKRNPGGQPGHKGANRDLVHEGDVEKIIPVFPDVCDKCGAILSAEPDPANPAGKYWRHQVIDIPEPKPEVIEYRLQCVRCSCGAENWGKIPQTARSGFGPRLTAFLAHLTGLHRVTRRGCQEITKTIFGIDMSLGSVCKLHQEVSDSLATAHEKARLTLTKQPVLNIDETGWNYQGETRWLWIFVAPLVAFYHIAASRGAKVLKEILGNDYKGILCSDMYSAYKAFHKGVRQFCWAHIIRGIKGIKHACRSPDAVRFSKWMLAETGRMFALWHAFKDGHLDRETLVRKSVPIRSRMSKCLQLYCSSSDPDVAKAAKSLLRHWHGLFTFLEYDGVEPTNNSAERAGRPAVQWRKICFGNQSVDGELLTARLLTAERSCILQGKNPFQFLLESVVAYRSGL
ncbi:MAG: IS66 family transposase, partial [Pseudomonadota bacterium]